MFKSLSELMTNAGETDAHKVLIVQVKTGVTSWGRRNQSSRPTAGYQIWMDTPDNGSRIVLKLDFMLSSRRSQPERNTPLNIEISQYASQDTMKRTWAERAPEHYIRLDSEAVDEFMSTSGVWEETSVITSDMQPDYRYFYPGTSYHVVNDSYQSQKTHRITEDLP